VTAPGRQPGAPGAPGALGGGAARPRLAWGGALAVAALLLFWCYLRQSQTNAVNADGAGMALAGWEMVHGNVLLSGWTLADVSFATFEVPIDGLVAAAHGLNSDVVHITAAIIYTLLVLSAALLARGTACGAEGVVRAVLAAGILVAPSLSPGTHVLLLSPDHTGVAVPILLALLMVDRSRGRWWGVVAMGVLLVWAQVDDPLATYAAAVPIALVCAVRAALPLLLRGRPGWYDAGLAASAAVSVEVTRLAVAAIHAAGGYTMRSFGSGDAQKIGKLVPFTEWGAQIRATGQNLLILFGANLSGQHGIWLAIAYLHLAGVAVAAAGLLAGVGCLFRCADRIVQILTVATLITVGAAALATQMLVLAGAHEIAVVLPFCAVLAGRTAGPWLAGRLSRAGPPGHWMPRARIALIPLLAAVLGGYLASLGYAAAQPARPAETQALADWLVAHHLTGGLARYWGASSTALSSGGRVQVFPVADFGQRPYTWVAKLSWYDPAVSRANFVIAMPGDASDAYSFSEAGVRRAFGAPAHEYRVGRYVVMLWNKNLLLQMKVPRTR
jgi:hypothetical protein